MTRTLHTAAAVALLLAPFTASAVPDLQLDIAGGFYDNDDESIVTADSSFTLYAYAAPDGQRFTTNEVLMRTFYVSAAIDGKVGPDHVDLGSFSVNGVVYDATADMIYGAPPLEPDGSAARDRGDLSQHGEFESFFIEVPFHFAAGDTSGEYNTQDDAGSGPIAGDDMYFAAFDIDVTGLAPGVELHFDLYTTGTRRYDTDIRRNAPFSHDAGTVSRGGPPTIPEPNAALVFGAGALMTGLATRRRA